ncbi:sialin-like [Diadema antillarum]|uniref:sialin-like n=1 Tax=Diadema antillarum TaxID=105358 RepID=UPI003A88BA28
MGFFGFSIVYALRVTVSIGVPAMINSTYSSESDPNGTGEYCQASDANSSSCNEDTGEYEWDSSTQELILAGFFYGYLFTQLPGGWMADKFGGKYLFAFGVLCTCLCSLAFPFLARVGVAAVFASRVISGLGEGMTFAAMYSMFAMWIPSKERSRLPVYTFSGSCLGNILGQAVSGSLANSDILGGWPAPFFLFGTLGLIWFCVWLCLAFDSPAEHPRISTEERKYIESGISVKPRSKSKEVPWGKILTSMPVWAIVVAHLTACWCYFTLLTNLPIYMNNVLRLDLTTTGIFSAVPYAFQWLSMLLIGIPADRLINGGALPRTTVRKLLVVTGHLGFGITNALVGVSGCNSALSVVFLSLGLLFAGVTFGGYLTNTLDLAPAYSGSIGGLVQTAGPVSGILGPYAVGVLTVDQNDLLGWKKVFYIGFGITAFGALFFALFSSGEEQPWANEDECDED